MFGFPTAQDSPRGLSGPSCCSLGALQGRLGALLGASWAILGSSWADLGSSWGPHGLSWGYLGGLLEASWAVLGGRKPEQARTSKSIKNQRKINDFCPLWNTVNTGKGVSPNISMVPIVCSRPLHLMNQESLSSLRVEVLIKTSQSTIAMVMSGSRLLYLRVRSRYAQSIQSMHKRLGHQKALSQKGRSTLT